MLERLIGLVAPPLCAACGADAGRATPLCAACRAQLARSALTGRAPPSASGLHVWSAFAYDGPAGALVRLLKFGGRARLADTMAAQVAAAAPPVLWDGAIVPVPLHPARLRSRGFNQAALLAASLGRRCGLQVVDCLRRGGDALPQTGRGRAARIRGPNGSVTVSGRVPPRALLVDDVVTTGGTLSACAKALTEAGCRDIRAITYARTAGR